VFTSTDPQEAAIHIHNPKGGATPEGIFEKVKGKKKTEARRATE
jgi:hypothetical protein